MNGNLGGSQFTRSSNPTSSMKDDHILVKDYLMIKKIYNAKLQSPELRQGVQQFSIKLDFLKYLIFEFS